MSSNPPSPSPTTKEAHLSGKGAKNIEVKIINVPRIKVVVSKIYENNLLAAQNSNYRPRETTGDRGSQTTGGSEEEGGDEPESGNSSGDLTVGDVIYEKEIDTRLLPRSSTSNINRIINLDITDKLPEFKGIYHVMIRSTKNY